MKKTVSILETAPLFNGLPEDQLQQIAQIATECTYPKGSTIFLEGDEGRGFFVIAEGMVKVFKVSADGKEQILHIFGTGEPLGEVSVFTGIPFPAAAQAISRVRTLFFARQAFSDLIAKNPSLALNMLAVLSKRLRHFTVQIKNLSLKEVSERLASYLMTQIKKRPLQGTLRLDISKGDLASLLGTTPETLSRVFAKLTIQKLIDVNGRTIKLVDTAALAELAGHRD